LWDGYGIPSRLFPGACAQRARRGRRLFADPSVAVRWSARRLRWLAPAAWRGPASAVAARAGTRRTCTRSATSSARGVRTPSARKCPSSDPGGEPRGYATRPDRTFSVTIGRGRCYATGGRLDGTHARRLDLSHLVDTLPTAALMRIADRWGRAHGYIQR